ncbi:MAG: S9 family peptidase [Opitutaceae bacterium]|nr:S9 family peptidase [Cephaloticoccus sp.]MCP5530748.1 S9 family peptidase [Opitutaceae bacterium]
MSVNEPLIRERCSYRKPVMPVVAESKRATRIDVKFIDTYGNQLGDFFWRELDGEWQRAFSEQVHACGYSVHDDHAVIASVSEDGLRVDMIRSAAERICILKSKDYVRLDGLSANGRYVLLETGIEADRLHPSLIVIDLDGRIRGKLSGHNGIHGCWAGGWSPVDGDYRIVAHVEDSGFARPVIWHPLTGKVSDVSCDLTGEVWAEWVPDGQSLLLTRHLQARCDLHRWYLADGRCETIQPLDGYCFRAGMDASEQVVGLWSSGADHVRVFVGQERLPFPEFQPTRPLSPWVYREIAGVPCLVVEPAGGQAGILGTIFEVYGGFSYHHVDCYNAFVHSLVDHGFKVVLVNTRGCNGFGRAWRDASLSDIGQVELSDVAAVRKALVDSGEVDPMNTLISGSSWGGYMVLLAMGVQPELWRAGIANVPVGDFVHAHYEATPCIRSSNWVQFGGTPQTKPEAYRRASPMTYVQSVKAPVMIATGKYDTLCPPEQNRRYAEALRQHGTPCEFIEFEGAHGPADSEERIRLYTAMIDFALRHSG